MGKLVLSDLTFLKDLPKLPGVYFFKNKKGKIIYIGAATSLKNRVSSYFRQNHPSGSKTARLVLEIALLDYEIHSTVEEAFLRERELIGLHKPKYNVIWIDDKTYPLLKITVNEDFPRLLFVRNKIDDGAEYYRRRYNAKILRNSIKELRCLFPICNCNKMVKSGSKKRPCLSFDLKLCPAPCVGKISKEEYTENVLALRTFLKGELMEIVDKWESVMIDCSENLEFEKAALYRDRIQLLQKSIEYQKSIEDRDFDVIGIGYLNNFLCIQRLLIKNKKILREENVFYKDLRETPIGELLESFLKETYLTEEFVPQRLFLPIRATNQDVLEEWLTKSTRKDITLDIVEKQTNKWLRLAEKGAQAAIQNHLTRKNSQRLKVQEALQELKELLSLENLPQRIEGFDISSFHGLAPVGSMVVFQFGFPEKSKYRRFQIKTVQGQNDVAMIREVLYRRLTNKEIGDLPDIILVDGGKPQLASALQVLDRVKMNIPLIALAKREEEIFLPGRKKSVLLSRRSSLLSLLCRVRDESHRFAVSYHRIKRKSMKLRSKLDQIPGIGKKRRDILLQHFGSIYKVAHAQIEELTSVPGINQKIAEKIYLYFQNERKGRSA